MWRKIIALLFLSSVAQASPLPCSPVFIAGPQGRPIPGAVVSVVNTNNTPIASGVWANTTGTVPFTGQMPTNQILQVFIEPGIYQATVSGSGVTKTYDIICGDGFGSSVRTISISRSAELLLNTMPNAPILDCSATGTPCLQIFSGGVDSPVTFDWVAPSYPVTFESILVTWHTADVPVGMAVWRLDWCTYAEGDLNCVPSGAHAVDVTSVATAGHRRVDMLVLPVQWPLAWNANDHVVVSIERHGSDTRDTLAIVAIENVRMEMLR